MSATQNIENKPTAVVSFMWDDMYRLCVKDTPLVLWDSYLNPSKCVVESLEQGKVHPRIPLLVLAARDKLPSEAQAFIAIWLHVVEMDTAVHWLITCPVGGLFVKDAPSKVQQEYTRRQNYIKAIKEQRTGTNSLQEFVEKGGSLQGIEMAGGE